MKIAFIKKRKNEDMQKRILEGGIYKTLLLLAIPIMINNLSQTLYSFVDSYWVSKLGDEAMAAISFVWPVNYLLATVGIGVCIAGTALISQYLGRRDYYSARKMAGQVASFTMVLSVVFGLLGFFLTNFMITLMGGEGALLELGGTYLRICFLGIPINFINFIYASIRQAEGDTVTPMLFSFGSNIINCILDPIFIFNLDFGIAGAAYATIIGYSASAIIQVYLLFKSKNGIHLRLKDLKLEWPILKHVSKIAFPSIIGNSMSALGFTVMMSIVVGYSTATLTALSIGNKITGLLQMPTLGLGSAISTMVGQNLGAGNVERSKEAVKKALIMASSAMVVAALIMFVFAPNFAGIFTKEAATLALAVEYLRYAGPIVFLMVFLDIYGGVFRGSGHTKSNMIMEVARLWIFRVPLLIVMPMIFGYIPKLIWIAMILSNLLTAILSYLIYRRGTWQKPVIRNKQEEDPLVL